MVSTQISSATIGFPRIGPNREMKKALESFWSGKSTADDLRTVAEQTERVAWLSQKDAGLDLVALDSTYYDQILDFITYLGLIPKRFQVRKGSCSHEGRAEVGQTVLACAWGWDAHGVQWDT